uniref:Ferrochelatase n=1 Tax=Herpetomonas muscarum TaxID=5718 RepID=G1C9R0_HERMU|nr:ferrochelatase [Herpetomonas muscarum]
MEGPASTPDKPITLVLMVNLGSPSAPTTSAIRSFLRPFLSDRRVIDVPRPIWLPILYGFILPFRPQRLVGEYAPLWINNMSPLLYHTGRLRERVERSLKDVPQGPTGSEESTNAVIVRMAMRYGEGNTIPIVLKQVHEEHPRITKLVVLPMFPQYTSTTTACIFDEVFRFYLNPWRRCVPGMHLIRDYATNPSYIAAVGDTIIAALSTYFDSIAKGKDLGTGFSQCGDDLVVLLSYHSIPYRYYAEGDDYVQRCEATTAAITAYLSKQAQRDVSNNVVQVYQSKFGRERWLEPFFEDAVIALPRPCDTDENRQRKQEFADHLSRPKLATRQARACIVATPGFAVDCLETVHEVKEEGGELFMENGGRYFAFVPCLNDKNEHSDALVSIVKEYL